MTVTAAFAVVLATFPAARPGHAAPLSAGQAVLSAKQAALELADQPEPFGRLTSEVVEGPLLVKWRSVQKAIDAEMSLVTLCRADPSQCPSPAAVEFLSIVERARQRAGLARAGEINRAINLDIRPASDLAQYQVPDFWSSPLATLAARAGDCEDYAIAKLVALREAGISPHDLRLVILRDLRSQDDHAVVTVRIDDRWRVLDSRRFLMLEDTQLDHLQPLFAIDDTGIKRYADGPQISASTVAARPYF